MAEQETRSRGRAGSEPVEHRRYPRYPFSTDAEVVEIVGRTRITGRVTDIAKKGCYVDTLNPFSPKASLAVKITRGGQSFETAATVVYCQSGLGMGLYFTITQTEHLRTLETWLSELSGESQPEIETETFQAAPSPKVESFEPGEQRTRNVLRDLVRSLIRTGVVAESEGRTMIERLQK